MAGEWIRRFPATQPTDTANVGQMAFDAARNRVVLFGAEDIAAGHATDETWLWDGSTWTHASPVDSPPARAVGGLVYDPIREKLVLFGGAGIGVYLNDTWEWDGTNWTEITTANAPDGRYIFFMGWCANTSKIIAFGGSGAAGFFGDTWEYDGIDWTELSPGSSPATREGVACCRSHDGAGVMIYGGGSDIANYFDAWVFDGADWSLVNDGTGPRPPGTLLGPSYSVFGTMARDSHGEILWINGITGSNDPAKQWMFDGADWTEVFPSPVPAFKDDNTMQQVAYDSTRGEVVLFPHRTGGAGVQTWVWRYPIEVTPTYQRVYGLEIQLTNDGVEGPVTVRTSAQSQQA